MKAVTIHFSRLCLLLNIKHKTVYTQNIRMMRKLLTALCFAFVCGDFLEHDFFICDAQISETK